MSDAEKRFNAFLSRIKAITERPPVEYYEELAREEESFWQSLSDIERYHEEIIDRHIISPGRAELILRIMESGIFYRGGLRGGQLDFDGKIFEVHHIQSLEDFVVEAVNSLDAFSYAKDIQGRENWIREEFKCIEKKFDKLLPTVRLYKGGRAAQKLERKRKELSLLQEDILQRHSKTPKLPDIKKDLAAIFHKYAKAPKVIIAERISDLLNYFGIDAKMESIRKKLRNK